MIGARAIKTLLGPKWTTWARTVTHGLERPVWGNLRRTSPISPSYGFERGTPIDRFYVDRFLSARRALITGRVLEIQTTDHIRRYGMDVAKGILTSVRVAKDSQESAIASGAQKVEDVLCQAAWWTVAKARRSSEQYEKIGATRLKCTSGSEGYSLFLANL